MSSIHPGSSPIAIPCHKAVPGNSHLETARGKLVFGYSSTILEECLLDPATLISYFTDDNYTEAEDDSGSFLTGVCIDFANFAYKLKNEGETLTEGEEAELTKFADSICETIDKGQEGTRSYRYSKALALNVCDRFYYSYFDTLTDEKPKNLQPFNSDIIEEILTKYNIEAQSWLGKLILKGAELERTWWSRGR
jgi:hypothetical protein